MEVVDSLFADNVKGIGSELSMLAEGVRKSITGNLTQISDTTSTMRNVTSNIFLMHLKTNFEILYTKS